MKNDDKLDDIISTIKGQNKAILQTALAFTELNRQNAAMLNAIHFLTAELRKSGLLNNIDLANRAVEHVQETLGADDVRDQILRNILNGNPPQMTELPKFSLILGGKDRPPPEGSV